MDSYLALEWHEPRFNFATMSRDLGRWSAKAVCYDAAAHTFSDICDGVLLNLDTRDAFDYFGSGSISAEELDLMKDKIASRTNATAPCQQRKTEVDILKQHLAADKYTAEKLIRAKAEIARLEGLLDLADAYAIAAE